MVQTRSQTQSGSKTTQSSMVKEDQTTTEPSIEMSPIMGPDDPAVGKPPCYLSWGRFLTPAEYNYSSGKTLEQVSSRIVTEKPKHDKSWDKTNHYMAIGGQCGQSCGCCRAELFKSGVDPDGKFGACDACL